MTLTDAESRSFGKAKTTGKKMHYRSRNDMRFESKSGELRAESGVGHCHWRSPPLARSFAHETGPDCFGKRRCRRLIPSEAEKSVFFEV